MTKIICINQKRLGQGIGYGLWSLLTFGLVLMMFVTTIESQSLEPVQRNDWGTYYEYCYKSLFSNEQECTRFYNELIQWQKPLLFQIFNGINVLVMGVWIYNKQQKVKFSWCKNTKEDWYK